MRGFDIHFKTIVGGVYALTHTATGRQYVGSSVNLYKRVSKHLSELKQLRHHSPILQNGWSKHGADAFEFSILEVVTNLDTLIEREQHWLDALDPHYNICKVAQSIRGIKRSIETRHKMSVAMKGKIKSKETIEKIRATSTGRTHSEETKVICGNASRGIRKPPRTREHSAKIVALQAKSYLVTPPGGEEFEIFNLREFCQINSLDQGNMSKVRRGEANHHKGWKIRSAANECTALAAV